MSKDHAEKRTFRRDAVSGNEEVLPGSTEKVNEVRLPAHHYQGAISLHATCTAVIVEDENDTVVCGFDRDDLIHHGRDKYVLADSGTTLSDTKARNLSLHTLTGNGLVCAKQMADGFVCGNQAISNVHFHMYKPETAGLCKCGETEPTVCHIRPATSAQAVVQATSVSVAPFPAPTATMAVMTMLCSNANCRVERYKGGMMTPFNTCPLCNQVGTATGNA